VHFRRIYNFMLLKMIRKLRLGNTEISVLVYRPKDCLLFLVIMPPTAVYSVSRIRDAVYDRF